MSRFLFPDVPGQRGLASTAQLLAAGASEWELNQLALRGQRVLRSVYADRPRALSADDLLVAGALWAGPDAVLTGATALLRHAIEAARPSEPTRFLVPTTHRTRRNPAGMVTERTRRPPRSQIRDGVPVASVERALVDAGRHRELSEGELMGCTLAVLQRRLCTVERIAAEIGGGGDAGTSGVQQGIEAFRAGAWSRPEAVLADGVRRHPRLPVMLANPRLVSSEGVFLGTPDGYFPDAGVVVQVHSRQFHDGIDAQGRDRWSDTLEKDLVYQHHGLVVVPVAPRSLTDDLRAFLDTLASVVERRRGLTPTGIIVELPRQY